MSEYDYSGEEFAAENGWSEWQASYDTQPVQTAWEMAQLAAAQQAQAQPIVDVGEVATQAMVQMEQLQRAQAEQAAIDRDAKTLSRSLTAAHGQDWIRHEADVYHRIETDEKLQAEFTKARDLQECADLLERELNVVKNQPSAKFREIMNAPSDRLGL